RSFTTTAGNSAVSIVNGFNGYRYVQFSAAAGTRNSVAVREHTINGALHYVVVDGGFAQGASTVLAGAGCQPHSQGTSTYDNAVRCPAAGIDHVKVLLGDGADNAEMFYNTTATASLNGGTGADQLYGSRNDDRLIGGTGFDLFSARGGSDTIDARHGDVDEAFHCGELGADNDAVIADLDDQVLSDAANCETVDKP
ncbi:MAG TPA: hypothetical protein VEQ61_10905, partial [Thermoleophilaceae bacterium]|nr:hypothetical protein [Thermoleophilaceae bacterium]